MQEPKTPLWATLMEVFTLAFTIGVAVYVWLDGVSKHGFN